ncbi:MULTISPECIES: CPBP family intramembrane glutamic endopeptidase [Pseudonocardia]|uniref:CAAX amino terminal protease self-immunity n=2 Tax=Pseudonocardia TaxID=1847 RepID=A0A1Y2MQA3_PSEAH|nr:MULTISPECIES: type II CAAX endopeptidase family protein [Pseudonocardia]OSY37403.1 CAAX amino terminal protease self- immunity [Pseudonocardia autotrophica]TDN77272.1 membrane protease YdiL (CAAX protease family) [Pseudonocardia autotrophica]BBG01291.1 CAAX amino protease [Pseudonocardia autotrophica]GEC26018.1 CAAX amino protease [Pseudonocardia saturnea]
MAATTEQGGLPEPGPESARAVPAGVEYHRVLAGERRRIGRGVLAIVLLLAGMVVLPTVLGRMSALVDAQLGNTPTTVGGTDYTPLQHATTMIALGLLAPWSMLVQRLLYGAPGASLHSVVSRFRLDLLGRALLVLGPGWLIVNGLGALVAPAEEMPWSQAELLVMFLVVLVLTPLQATGEEYGFRGLMFRVLGSWARGRRAGLVTGVLASSVLFTAVHGSTDPYINVWYFVLGAGLAVITWRTGGIEVAVVLHAVLNTGVFLVAVLLRIDLGAALQDRSAGVGSPYQLVPTLAVVVITAAVWWWARGTGPARTPAARAGDEAAATGPRDRSVESGRERPAVSGKPVL